MNAFVAAVGGQPNTGKSTVFNLLTGFRQEVGNWAGKTVEKRAARAPAAEGGYTVIDLPGTYSLRAESEDERIAAEFIMRGEPDLVVVVANAASPERTLYYALDVLLLNKQCLVALNMMDVAEANGMAPSPAVMEAALGLKVIPLVASRGVGEGELRAAIREAMGQPLPFVDIAEKLSAFLPGRTRAIYNELRVLLQQDQNTPRTEREAGSLAWKALEADPDALRALMSARQAEGLTHTVPPVYAGEDAQQARYLFLEAALGDMHTKEVKESRTAAWDKWLLHPVLGPLCMLGILFLSLVVGFGIGFPLAIIAWKVLQPAEAVLLSLLPENMLLLRLLGVGVFRGVGAVMSMLPFIFVFYGVFAVLEDTGYMSRAAFLMDGLMSRIGLDGKAFIPLLFALPCNIPGIMACRTVSSTRSRTLVFLLIPLVPCSAKLIVLTTMAFWLFPPLQGTLLVFALCVLNLALLVVCSKLCGLFMAKESNAQGLLMELPHYHRPNPKTVFRAIFTNCAGFLKKASTLIVSFSALVWFVSYYPSGQIETSWLGQFGQALAPLGTYMGADWRMLTALFSSAVSKEASLATMGIIYGVPLIELPQTLRATITPASAMAFMCAQSLFIPCISTLGMLYKESHSARITLSVLAYTFCLPMLAASLVYTICTIL